MEDPDRLPITPEVAEALGLEDVRPNVASRVSYGPDLPTALKLIQQAQEAFNRSASETLPYLVRLAIEHLDGIGGAAWWVENGQVKGLVGGPKGQVKAIQKSNDITMASVISLGEDVNYPEPLYYEAPLDFTIVRAGSLIGSTIANGDNIVGGIYIVGSARNAPFGREQMTLLRLLATFAALGAQLHTDLEESEKELDEALESLEGQSSYLRAVSHDIRSPLTIIDLSAGMMLRHSENLQDSDREQLYKITAQTKRIAGLVTRLLEMAKLQSGALKLEQTTIDLVEMIELYLNNLPEKDRIQASLPEEKIYFVGDPVRVEQIIANLVGNAIKYGGDQIQIKLYQDTDHIHIDISDNGPGLPDNIRQNLFKRFVPGAKDIGLGLSIAHALALAHGGDLTYEDNDPHGAVFKIALPTLQKQAGKE